MKFSLVKNDKTTIMDEVILAVIIVVCMAIGIFLMVMKPTVWIVDSNIMVVIGAMAVIFGVMFIPCLIYRLMTNDKKDK